MKRSLVLVALLLGLLVVADRGAEMYAESALAARIDAELDQRPDVEIKGFSFLAQALRGEYDEITVSGARASRNGLGVSDFRADLRGVKIPLSDVLAGDVQRVPTQTIRGSAVVAFPDLAEVAGSGISIEADGADRVRVTSTLSVLGRSVQASAVSEVRLDGESLVLRAVSYEVDGAPAPDAVADAVGDDLDLRLRLPVLPYDLAVDDLVVTDGGIRLAARARGVVLTG